MVVKSSEANIDEIYCNEEKLCKINCTSPHSKYSIYYDDISKLWLVINGDGNAVIIKT